MTERQVIAVVLGIVAVVGLLGVAVYKARLGDSTQLILATVLPIALTAAVALVLLVPSQQDRDETGAWVRILHPPPPAGTLRCDQRPDGHYICPVGGDVRLNDQATQQVILWVRSAQPDAGGWYADTRVNVRGSDWAGVVQVGDREHPPSTGDNVQLAATILDSQSARKLQAGVPYPEPVEAPGTESGRAEYVVEPG